MRMILYIILYLGNIISYHKSHFFANISCIVSYRFLIWYRPLQTPRPWRQPQLRTPHRLDSHTEWKIHEQHAADASQLPSPQPNPWPMGPSLNDLSAAVHSRIVCCSKSDGDVWTAPGLCPAQISRFRIGALAAAEYGRLTVWAHSPVCWGLRAASTAAGRCIGAGAPPRPLTRFRFWF